MHPTVLYRYITTRILSDIWLMSSNIVSSFIYMDVSIIQYLNRTDCKDCAYPYLVEWNCKILSSASTMSKQYTWYSSSCTDLALILRRRTNLAETCTWNSLDCPVQRGCCTSMDLVWTHVPFLPYHCKSSVQY